METNQPPQQTPQSDSKQKTNVFAILALVCVFLLWPLGVILGIIALVQIKKDPNQKGKEIAIIGLVLGCLFFLLSVLFIGGIILATLGSKNFMDPSTLIPIRCITEPGFDCFKHEISANGTVSFSLFNGKGRDISSITVTLENRCTPIGVAMSNGETIRFTCTGTPGESGEIYIQDMNIKYTLLGDTYEKTATGSLSVRYP